VSAPQHLPDHLDVGAALEDVRGDCHAVLPKRLGESSQGFGLVSDEESLSTSKSGVKL
jgi:hypothetical protein